MSASLHRIGWIAAAVVALAFPLAGGLARAQDWRGQGRLEGMVLGPDGAPVSPRPASMLATTIVRLMAIPPVRLTRPGWTESQSSHLRPGAPFRRRPTRR